jgi:hypothetical protein
VKQPKFLALPNGVRVSHCERIRGAEKSDGVVHSVRVHPDSTKFAKGLGKHFQQFRIRHFHIRWVPKTGTDSKGTVSVAPYYDSEDPTGGKSTNAIFDISTLPGSKEFAIWATGKASWLATQASRAVFRNVGLNVFRAAGLNNQATQYDESKIPGYLLYKVDPGADEAAISGSWWVEYEFDFHDPIATDHKDQVTFYSTSTDGGALALESAAKSGNDEMVYVEQNVITFHYSGNYTLIIVQNGTSLATDNDGHLIYDKHGDDVTSLRVAPVFDASAQTLAAATNSGSQLLCATEGTRAVSMFFLNIEAGDRFVVDDLSSGTLAGTRIFLQSGGPYSAMIP